MRVVRSGKHFRVYNDTPFCAKKIVTQEGVTDSGEQVVVPKVGVTRHAQRYEQKDEG